MLRTLDNRQVFNLMADISFLIIGAEKAGSTSLFKYMQRHPQIHMPAEKELNFFNVEDNYRRGWHWYLTNVLRGAPSQAVCGEAGQYMTGDPFGEAGADKHPDLMASLEGSPPFEEVIPERIKQYLPDVKLICILRDPVARAYSEYRMGVLDRVESRSFEEAIDQLLEPSVMEYAKMVHTRTNGYVVSGEYARILAGFLRSFSRKQLMVIFSDELEKQPAETLAALFKFIGVAASFVPDNVNTRYRTAAVKQRIPMLQLYIWRENFARIRLARAFWFALPTRVRTITSRVYTVMAHQIGLWNAQRGVLDDDMSPLARQRLITHFRPDSAALGNMLDRQIPWLEDWS